MFTLIAAAFEDGGALLRDENGIVLHLRPPFYADPPVEVPVEAVGIAITKYGYWATEGRFPDFADLESVKTFLNEKVVEACMARGLAPITDEQALQNSHELFSRAPPEYPAQVLSQNSNRAR